ncbi:hypothetical protein Pst134EA_031562 [Puccinia striiformis f. sp. tritici]|uniref:uncharacterized protein n=1 Tax=Puccinia striiformis f. sp. tritici TaxID=168172 RepID=UPI0020081CFF|nr:uncharacterized protein Pst134EA_031562 [Puccinia striiformis f. sp. tritici]KAH9445241.1 hypothetical protein Pst134EA_031562 [Puccinia striiformis f. sp. tritici]
MNLHTMLLLTHLASIAAAIDDVTEALPRMREVKKMDNSLLATSEDESLSYASAIHQGHQLAETIILSDRDCYSKVAQRHLPQALFDSESSGGLWDSSIFRENVLTIQDYRPSLHPRFLDIVRQSQRPGGLLDDAFCGPLGKKSNTSKKIAAYLENPPLTMDGIEDDVTQYLFVFQLWRIATRFAFPASDTGTRKGGEDVTLQEAMSHVASTLIVLHNSQVCPKMAPSISHKGAKAYSLSQETPEYLFRYGYTLEKTSKDDQFIDSTVGLFSQPYDHYKRLKEDKRFKRWAQSKAPLCEIYNQAMAEGKDLSKGGPASPIL